MAPRPLWRLPPPASVASPPPFFTAPGSGSPSPVEVAPAGLCRVVASILHGPRQWLPVPCGGCPLRPFRVASIFSGCPHRSLWSSPSTCSQGNGSSYSALFYSEGWRRFGRICRLQLCFQIGILTSSQFTRYFRVFTTHFVLTLFRSTNFLEFSLITEQKLFHFVLTNNLKLRHFSVYRQSYLPLLKTTE